MKDLHLASQSWQTRMFKDLEDAAVAQVVARAEDGFERPMSEAALEDLEERLVHEAHCLHASLMPRMEVAAVSLAWILADWPLDEDLFWDRMREAVEAPASTSGKYAPASTSGFKAPASTSGNYAPASTSGDYAPASTSGDYAPASTSGKKSMAIVAGTGRAQAGEGGCICMAWWDALADRPRMAVGYIGETCDASRKTLKPGAWYEVNDNGKFVAVEVD